MDIIIKVSKAELSELGVSESKLSSWIWAMISGRDEPLTNRVDNLNADVLHKANVKVEVNLEAKVSG